MKASQPRILFAIALTLFIGVVGFTFREVDFLGLAVTVNPGAFVLCLLLGLAHYCMFGLLLRFGFRAQYGVVLDLTEVMTLPLMMLLFTYLLPIKGGLVFQVFYMKHRHRLDLSEGFSLGLMIFFITASLTVVLGLALTIYLQLHEGPIYYFLLALAMSLAILPSLLRIVPSHPDIRRGIAGQAVAVLSKVKRHLKDQSGNARLLFGLVASDAVLAVVQAIWYQQCARMLGLPHEFLSILLVALILRVALLLRVLPGNLGFQELVIGVVFTAAGFSIEEGLLVALAIRLVSTLLAATIGLAGLYANLRSMNMDSLPFLLREISEKER